MNLAKIREKINALSDRAKVEQKEEKQKLLELEIEVYRCFLRQPRKVQAGARLVRLNLNKMEHRLIFFIAVKEDVDAIAIHFKDKDLVERAFQTGRELILSN